MFLVCFKNFLNLTKKKKNYKKIDKFVKKNTTIYFLAFNKTKNASLKDYETNHKIITNFLEYIKNKKIKNFIF